MSGIIIMLLFFIGAQIILFSRIVGRFKHKSWQSRFGMYGDCLLLAAEIPLIYVSAAALMNSVYAMFFTH